MPVYDGDSAINYLAKKSQKPDVGSSSHWDKYHKDFIFKDGNFSGIDGFGSNEKQYIGFRKMAHYLLQKPFRKMARLFY